MACASVPGAVDLFADRSTADGGPDPKHATVAQLREHGFIDQTAVRNATVVTTTRNPFDFYLAEWFRTRTRWANELDDEASWVHSVKGVVDAIHRAVALDFGEWIESEIGDDARSGRTRRINRGHVDEAIVVLRMEAMDDDLDRLHPDLADVLGPIPHVNRTDRDREYRESYSPHSSAAVAAVHAADIERFGYRF